MNLALLSTGGTIEKTYNEHNGTLANFDTVLDRILSGLRLPDIQIQQIEVLNKDSIYMVDEDRQKILSAIQSVASISDAILITHGTDTLEITGEYLHERLPDPKIPIVLTGAMCPYEVRDTDAIQNVTESLLAVRLITPGVYVAMHNRVLKFPNVVKNRESLVFEKGVTESTASAE